ncbi:MAG: hypothetical protein CMD92_04865 [Gammaproteobacteria bacterium]|nr:hypothetical protein [Gammaproteobacteria bacterium]
MAKYRGITWQNSGAGPKVRVRRSIWLAELEDFGVITDSADDLPTRGALHRGSLGATSGTRGYVNLSTVNDLAVVDTQDHGLITDTAVTAAWKTNPENTNVVTPSTPTYALTHDAGTSVNEGTTITFTFTTTLVADGTQFLTSMTGQSTTGSNFDFNTDISGGGVTDGTQDGSAPGYPIGTQIITVNNNTATFQITINADDMDDGTGIERIKGKVHNTDLNGLAFPATTVAETAYITINDTSTSTPAQARTHYLRITGASYNTNINSYVNDHVDMSSDHPDWTANGMTTDVTIVKFVHAPSGRTIELSDTIPSNVFNLVGNSAYHTWGLNDTAYTNLHAPTGYRISGFTKDSQSSYTRWNIDYDGSQFGARATVLDQLFEGQVINNYENTVWLTLYDTDGYKYEFSHHRRSTNGYNDQFEYFGTTQVY